MREIFLIDASTGCSCCAGENFWAGPFLSLADAQEQARIYHMTKRLASQYSRNGNYRVVKEEAEEIGDSRFIIGDRVWGPDVEEKLI